MAFSSVHDMVELCKESGKPLYEVILESDLAESGLTRAESEAEMQRLWAVMRSTSDGYCGADRSRPKSAQRRPKGRCMPTAFLPM